MGESSMYIFNAPIFEVVPYATFSILFLLIISLIYLRKLILNYSEKKLPHTFVEFKLYEEKQDEPETLSLYHYINSKSFEKTNDPFFIDICRRYIRWGQLFIISFAAALADICFIVYVL